MQRNELKKMPIISSSRVVAITTTLIFCGIITGPIDAALTLEILNLTGAGPGAADSFERTAAVGGDFITEFFDPAGSSGTGTYAPFLRVQSNGPNGSLEQGYNTDLNTNYDIKPSFTTPAPINSVPIVTIGGTRYLEFSLDVNQSGNTNISLNQVQLFITAGDVQTFSLASAAAANNPSLLASTSIYRCEQGDRDFSTQYADLDSFSRRRHNEL